MGLRGVVVPRRASSPFSAGSGDAAADPAACAWTGCSHPPLPQFPCIESRVEGTFPNLSGTVRCVGPHSGARAAVAPSKVWVPSCPASLELGRWGGAHGASQCRSGVTQDQHLPGRGMEVLASSGTSCITTNHSSLYNLGKLRHGRGCGAIGAAKATSSHWSPHPELQRSSRKAGNEQEQPGASEENQERVKKAGSERLHYPPVPPPPSPPRSLANKCLFLQKKEVTGVGAALST